MFFISCSLPFSQKNDEEIARVGKKILYRPDLTDLIPAGTNEKDSISITTKYVEDWVLQQLILRKAELNLPAQEKDFRKQLEDYRNSLIIYQYESYLIRQNLDTNVTDREIEDYYETNKQNFELKDNIVQVNFVILKNKKLPSFPVKNYLNSANPDDKDRLENFCKKSAFNYFLEDQWIRFDDLLKIIPIETYNQQAFLENNRYFELQDSAYRYFVRFYDFKIKESISPLSFERETIRNIIINKRKLEIIEKMRRKIFEDGLKNNDFEIYSSR
jgi:hypothetical protein